jgi:hypothetical protein
VEMENFYRMFIGKIMDSYRLENQEENEGE